jgi:DNA-binding transcriptional LysR family regulator
LIQDLLQDRVDIGPVIQTEFTGAEQFQFRSIAKDTFIALMPKNHSLSNRSGIKLGDLRDELIVNLKDDSESTTFGLDLMKKCGFVPSRTVFADQIDSVALTILDTGGIYITGKCLAKLPFPGLVKIPIEDKEMKYTIFYAYKKNNKNPAIPLFIEVSSNTNLADGGGSSGTSA